MNKQELQGIVNNQAKEIKRLTGLVDLLALVINKLNDPPIVSQSLPYISVAEAWKPDPSGSTLTFTGESK